MNKGHYVTFSVLTNNKHGHWHHVAARGNPFDDKEMVRRWQKWAEKRNERLIALQMISHDGSNKPPFLWHIWNNPCS
jgi:hypothetical protein